jgi:hypothetical protein
VLCQIMRNKVWLNRNDNLLFSSISTVVISRDVLIENPNFNPFRGELGFTLVIQDSPSVLKHEIFFHIFHQLLFLNNIMSVLSFF